MHAQEKTQTQKRLEKTLSFQLSLVISTDKAYNNNQGKNKHLRNGENSISRVMTLLNSSVEFLTNNHKVLKEVGKYGPFKTKQ